MNFCFQNGPLSPKHLELVDFFALSLSKCILTFHISNFFTPTFNTTTTTTTAATTTKLWSIFCLQWLKAASCNFSQKSDIIFFFLLLKYFFYKFTKGLFITLIWQQISFEINIILSSIDSLKHIFLMNKLVDSQLNKVLKPIFVIVIAF